MYSDSKINLLIASYPSFAGTRKELAENLGMTLSAVDYYRKKNGLKKEPGFISQMNREKAYIKAEKERQKRGGYYETK